MANKTSHREGAMTLRRRHFLQIAAGAAALPALPRLARAQAYPARPVRIIVPVAPGGALDILARLIGQWLGEHMGQSFVIENRPGGGTNIGVDVVAHAAPDGYTLLVTTTALAINETLRETRPFTASDFRTVAIVASSPEALVTSPSNPANNLADFVKAAKGKAINFGSAGVGSGSHIEAEYFFKKIANIEATHVPFQGGAPAINATLGNQIDLLATTLGGGAAAQIAAGKLKGLGIAADKRAAVTPNVPTYAEAGFPGFFAASWVGFFAPAKTDPLIVTALNAAINDTIRNPDVQKKLATIGFDPIEGSAAQAEAMFQAEVTKWGEMVKALNLSIK
jgi:tripartite-type tricarboxylate transporter receptor subunit TctC